MSFPIVAQARDSINKAYVALQSWNTNPADIPLPDVINTKRPQLTDQQIATQYLKSIEGNPSIDINKIPKIETRDRLDHELPMVEIQSAWVRDKRSYADYTPVNRTLCSTDDYNPDVTGCDDELTHVAKAGFEYITSLTFELIGTNETDCICLDDVPRFIVCSDQNLNSADNYRYITGDHILDYRNVSSLYGSEGWCSPRWNWLFDCPTPASTTDQINQQINHAVNQPTRASIFLNQTQLDAYLRFREQNGELMNFTYVLVSDKSQPKAESAAGQIAAAVLGSLAGLGSVILGIVGVMKYRSRTPIGPLPSITTLNPLQSVQTQPGGPSPSGSNFHGAGTMSQTTVVGDDAESATIFVPPAGFEG